MDAYQILFRRLQGRIMRPLLATRMQRLAQSYLIAGRYKRVYHYHIRKTAGTSLNSAFQGLVGAGLQDIAQRNFIIRNNLVFVQHDTNLIEGGNYFYGNSHIPAHALNIPDNTFTITILRDPLERLISHYSHLTWVRDDPQAPQHEPAIRRLRREVAWIGSGFGEFVTRMPRSLLLNQLFMFSNTYSVTEAAERIAGCSYVGFISTFATDIAALAHTLELPLTLRWERRFGTKATPPATDLEIARELLQPEYDLLRLLQPRLETAASTNVAPAA